MDSVLDPYLKKTFVRLVPWFGRVASESHDDLHINQRKVVSRIHNYTRSGLFFLRLEKEKKYTVCKRTIFQTSSASIKNASNIPCFLVSLLKRVQGRSHRPGSRFFDAINLHFSLSLFFFFFLLSILKLKDELIKHPLQPNNWAWPGLNESALHVLFKDGLPD